MHQKIYCQSEIQPHIHIITFWSITVELSMDLVFLFNLTFCRAEIKKGFDCHRVRWDDIVWICVKGSKWTMFRAWTAGYSPIYHVSLDFWLMVYTVCSNLKWLSTKEVNVNLKILKRYVIQVYKCLKFNKNEQEATNITMLNY